MSEPSAPPTEIRIDELVEDYVKIRNVIAAKKKEFDALKLKGEEAMDKIEMRILAMADKLGVKNFATKFGTAYVAEKDFARVAGQDGWEKLTKYMVENNDFGLVEKRVAKLHFKEVMNQNHVDPTTMGVEYVIERTIQIRKN